MCWCKLPSLCLITLSLAIGDVQSRTLFGVRTLPSYNYDYDNGAAFSFGKGEKLHAYPFLTVRGGYSDYDGNYDDDYDEYDMEPEYPPPRRRPPPQRPPPQRSPPQRHQQQQQQRPHSRMKKHRPPPKRRVPRQPARRSKPPGSEVLDKTKELAKKSVDLATTATVSSIKTSGKAAYYLTAPKFVQRKEIFGSWRLDQSVGDSACAATIELTPRGDVITRYEGEESSTGYLFQSRKWPRSCTIEFEAAAFQGPSDDRPVRYYYRGSFRRKMADKNVIKITGKIYEVKVSRFGRGKSGPGEEVGSFVARRRISRKDGGDRDGGDGRKGEDENADVYDDNYDDFYDDDDDYYDDDNYDEYNYD